MICQTWYTNTEMRENTGGKFKMLDSKIKLNIQTYQRVKCEDAFALIFAYAQPRIMKTVGRYNHPTLLQDLESECYSVLEDAVIKFNLDGATDFGTYLYKVFDNACKRVVRDSGARKRDINQFDVVYLDNTHADSEGNSTTLSIADTTNIIETIVLHEELAEVLRQFDLVELQIADLSIQGFDDAEISRQLGVSRSAISQRRTKMRKKRQAVFKK